MAGYSLMLSIKANNLKSVMNKIGSLKDENVIKDVMSSVIRVSQEAFEESYNRTPFINATGNYHSLVKYLTLSKTHYRISATAPYSSFLELGHGSFAGYPIMRDTKSMIEERLDAELDNVLGRIIGSLGL